MPSAIYNYLKISNQLIIQVKLSKQYWGFGVLGFWLDILNYNQTIYLNSK